MKKDLRDRQRVPSEDALERYDWNKATRGRYASRFPQQTHAVVIAPDLWPHFGTADAVNNGLRLLVKITTLAKKVRPQTQTQTSKKRRAA